MKPAALIMLLFFTGCKTSSIYPAAGATLGGAAGSFAGPIAGGASALAGYSAGKAAQLASTHKTTLKALSQGDVTALVQQGLVQAKEQAPCIIFIDELDALGKDRGTVSMLSLIHI